MSRREDVQDNSGSGYWQDHSAKSDTFLTPLLEHFAETRLQTFRQFIQSPSLEIGAGAGDFAANAGITDVLDVSEESLLLVKKRNPPVTVHHYSKLPFEFRDASFKAVACNDVLHHVKETMPLDEFMREVCRILEPGGYCLVSDRRPILLNRLLLAVNVIGRRCFLALGPRRNTLGGNVELLMTELDYNAITAPFELVEKRHWRAVTSTILISMFYFISLVVPSRYLGHRMLTGVRFCERFAPLVHQDYLIVLRKAGSPNP